MTDEQKEQINEFVEHIQFKYNEGFELDNYEDEILRTINKLSTLKRVYNKTKDKDIKFMIFELKYKIAIMVVEYYDLEKKDPIQRVEEKRLNNLKKQKSA